jgi:hypothetical protein
MQLLVLVRRRIALEEQELGAQQATALGTVRHRHLRLGERAEIREHFDANAVGCPAIGVRGRAFDLLALLTRGERLFGGSQGSGSM